MNLTEFLTLLTRLTYFAIGLVTLLSFLRHRDRVRFDIMLVFAAFAIAVTFQELAALNNDTGLNTVTNIAVLAQPYLQLRVVDHFRRVSPAFMLFGLVGMVAAWWLLPLVPALLPATLAIVVWYVLVEGYATVAFISGAVTTAGVTRWRMSLASLGSALVLLVIGAAGLDTMAPALAPYVTVVTQFLSLASGLSYYLGFRPPRILRQWWQSAELYQFLREVNQIAPERRGREILDCLCDAANRAVGALASVAAQWNERTAQLETVSARTAGHVPPVASAFGPGEGIVGRAWTERRTLFARSPEEFSAPASAVAAQIGARSLVALPVLTAREPWGVLIVFLRQVPIFVDDDLNLLQLFVEQTAVILDHESMLNEQRAQAGRARVLAEISQALAEVTDDLGGLLNGIARRAVELLGDACVISLLSADRQLLRPVAVHDVDPQRLDDLRAAAPERPAEAPESLRGKVMRTGRALRIDDLAHVEGQAPPSNGDPRPSPVHSLLIVPLRVQARVIGTMGLSRHQPGEPYSVDDQRFVQDIADRAALAIATALENVERRQAEQTLRDSEERFREVFRVSPVAIGITRLDTGRLIDVNQSWERLFGYARDDALGRSPLEQGLSLEPAQRAELSGRQSDGLVVRDVEAEICTESGERRQVLLSMVPVELGGIRSSLSIVYDISERKRAEDALRRQTAVLVEQARLLDLAHDAILVRDLDGVILFWNHGAEEMYGWSRDDAEGQRTHALLKTKFPASLDDVIGELMRTGRWEGELEHTRRDGQPIVVASRWALQRDEREKPLAILEINNDISARKRAEGELRETAADLARSNADLEQFAYVASHDLQEPLQMVSSFVQLLKRRYEGKLDKDADEFIHYAADGALRMQTLINDLLDYSRVGTRGVPLRCVSTEQVLAQTLLNLQFTLEEQHAVVTHDSLPDVLGDESQLVQLFQNLIGNGVKFHGERPPWVHISAAPRDAMWQFCVRDNGIGIAPEYFDRIFTIFQRLHGRADYPGTGIGLAVCKKIVERHGGKIWVESSQGQGSTFYFTLPDARSAQT